MAEDFPPNELKPLAMMKKGMAENKYDCFGLAKGGEILGYAYFFKLFEDGREYLLLDYLAIKKENRNTGLGTKFFELLANYLNNTDMCICEAEDPDCSTDEVEKKLRLDRLAFYNRNHCIDTGVRAKVFGADYVVLSVYEKEPHNFCQVRDIYEKIYKNMVSAKNFAAKKVLIKN